MDAQNMFVFLFTILGRAPLSSQHTASCSLLWHSCSLLCTLRPIFKLQRACYKPCLVDSTFFVPRRQRRTSDTGKPEGVGAHTSSFSGVMGLTSLRYRENASKNSIVTSGTFAGWPHITDLFSR